SHPGAFQSEFERRPCRRPKVLVTVHQRPQPRVFELLEPPDLRDELTLVAAQARRQPEHRLNVVERAVGVEDDGANCHVEMPPLSEWGGADRRRPSAHDTKPQWPSLDSTLKPLAPSATTRSKPPVISLRP